MPPPAVQIRAIWLCDNSIHILTIIVFPFCKWFFTDTYCPQQLYMFTDTHKHKHAHKHSVFPLLFYPYTGNFSIVNGIHNNNASGYFYVFVCVVLFFSSLEFILLPFEFRIGIGFLSTCINSNAQQTISHNIQSRILFIKKPNLGIYIWCLAPMPSMISFAALCCWLLWK